MSMRSSVIGILNKDLTQPFFFNCLRVPLSSRCFLPLSNRRCYTSVEAAKTSSHVGGTLPLPAFVQKKLSILKHEVINSLLDRPTVAASLEKSAPKCTDDLALRKMAEYYFNQGGKLLRPTVTLLMAYACNQLNKVNSKLTDNQFEEISLNQYRIAVISEMIHTASLVHDDVIDESDVRRGSSTVNALWGNKMAVLVGDYILARATQILCSIGRPRVISVMALIIQDLVEGEFMQMTSGGVKTNAEHFEEYMAKTYSKSASLFANSCKSVAMLADSSGGSENIAYEYGRALGMAFQLIDDLLDFVSTSSVMGKPTANDLKSGLATAPVLFAAEEHPELNELISRRFSHEGDPTKAWELVMNSKGLEKTRSFAKDHALQAARLIATFPNSNGVRNYLVELAISQCERIK